MKLIFLLALLQGGADWTKWGGPNQNFNVPDAGLAEKWPFAGPTKLWSRALGEGYSPISEHNGILFTMYRRDKSHESVVALDAASGKTLWEHQWDAVPQRMSLENGPGPHMMPVVADGRVFAVGITAMMFALDEKTGKVIWQHDLVADFQAERMGRGYANTPLPYKDTLLVPIGGNGHAIVALSQKDGKLVWKNTDNIGNSFSSPILINVGGQEQAIFYMADEVDGIAPATGKLLWRFPHKTDWGLNISTPIWGGGNLLFVSSAYSGGSRLLQLTRQGDATTVKELWFTNRMRVHFMDAIRKGGYIFASSGDLGPSFFSAVELSTGKEVWRERGYGRFSMVQAGEKTVMLDEEGVLVLAKLDGEGMHVLSKSEVLKSNSWTAPTLVGTKLYIRDRHNIMALDLK